MKFEDIFLKVLLEAGQNTPQAPPMPPKGENKGKDSKGKEDESEADLQADEEELDPYDEFEDEEKVYPEELELARFAIRALYFNIDSKDVHRFAVKARGRQIPFEKLTDYFEETKDWKPVLAFIEFIMDKYEGISSKWTEQPEVKGKGIIDKIKHFNKTLPEEEKLDNGKRVYWVRLILNCLLRGNPDINLNISDVNEDNIVEIFRLLKQQFGTDTRGIRQNIDLRAPGVFG